MNQNALDAARTAMGELASRRRTGQEHPSPEDIAAYQEQRLEGESYEEVRQHLLDCVDCMVIWRGLRQLAEEPPTPAASSEFERALFRRSLETRLAAEGDAPEQNAPPATVQASPHRPPGTFFPKALAAALLAAVLGLSLWNLEQRRTLDLLSAPQGNVTAHYLTPASAQRSPGTNPTPQVIASDTGSLLQITPPPDGAGSTPPPTYTLRILDLDDQPIWRQTGNQTDGFGGLTIYLPPGALEPGSYRLQLAVDGEVETLDEYRVEVH